VTRYCQVQENIPQDGSSQRIAPRDTNFPNVMANPPSLTIRAEFATVSDMLRFHLLAASLLAINGGLLTHSSQDNNVWAELLALSVYGKRPIELSSSRWYLLVSFSSTLNSLLIRSPISPSGTLTSSLVTPSSVIRERKPSSEMSIWESVSKSQGLHLIEGYQLTSWYSRRETLGTSMLWVDGHRSSSFLPVKMSMATRWTLA
jgi:hypothetical protein